MASLFAPSPYLLTKLLSPSAGGANGGVYVGSTTFAGVAIPAYNATAQVFGLWNPAGSGVNIVLVSLDLSIATAGTEALASLGLSYLANTGNAIATGAPVSAFTQTASLPGLIGSGAGQAAPSQGRFTLSATITAPTFYRSLGMTETIAAGASTVTTGPNVFQLSYQFSGADGVAPGTYIGLGGSAAPGSTFAGSLCWLEIPVGQIS
jgi:hypothetical protein